MVGPEGGAVKPTKKAVFGALAAVVTAVVGPVNAAQADPIDTINSVLGLVDTNPVLCPIFVSIGPQNIGGEILMASDGSVTIIDPLGLIVVTDDCSSATGPQVQPPPPCTTRAGQTVCASLTSTTLADSYAVSPPSSAAGPDAGSIDKYAFTLPNGGMVTLVCVVLVSGSTTIDPCATAGGTNVGTVAMLSDAPTTPVASVNVCNANLELSVDGIGINSFPAFVVC